jgi:hypothetical protein
MRSTRLLQPSRGKRDGRCQDKAGKRKGAAERSPFRPGCQVLLVPNWRG